MKRVRIALFVAFAALAAACAPADDAVAPVATVSTPAETDIWVAELLDSGRRLRVGVPVNATDRPGYDNQPYFLPDGSGFDVLEQSDFRAEGARDRLRVAASPEARGTRIATMATLCPDGQARSAEKPQR